MSRQPLGKRVKAVGKDSSDRVRETVEKARQQFQQTRPSVLLAQHQTKDGVPFSGGFGSADGGGFGSRGAGVPDYQETIRNLSNRMETHVKEMESKTFANLSSIPIPSARRSKNPASDFKMPRPAGHNMASDLSQWSHTINPKEISAQGGAVTTAQSLDPETRIVTDFNPTAMTRTTNETIKSTLLPLTNNIQNLVTQFSSLQALVPRTNAILNTTPQLRATTASSLALCGPHTESFLYDWQQKKAYSAAWTRAGCNQLWKSGSDPVGQSSASASSDDQTPIALPLDMNTIVALDVSPQLSSSSSSSYSSSSSSSTGPVVVNGGDKVSRLYMAGGVMHGPTRVMPILYAMDYNHTKKTLTPWTQIQNPTASAALLQGEANDLNVESGRVIDLEVNRNTNEIFALMHLLPINQAPDTSVVVKMTADGKLVPEDQWSMVTAIAINAIPMEIHLVQDSKSKKQTMLLCLVQHEIDFASLYLYDSVGKVLDSLDLGSDVWAKTITADTSTDTFLIAGYKVTNYEFGYKNAWCCRVKACDGKLQMVASAEATSQGDQKQQQQEQEQENDRFNIEGVRALANPASNTVLLVGQAVGCRGTDQSTPVLCVLDGSTLKIQKTILCSSDPSIVDVKDATWNADQTQVRLVGRRRFVPFWYETYEGWAGTLSKDSSNGQWMWTNFSLPPKQTLSSAPSAVIMDPVVANVQWIVGQVKSLGTRFSLESYLAIQNN